jgi:hypothetical protein
MEPHMKTLGSSDTTSVAGRLIKLAEPLGAEYSTQLIAFIDELAGALRVADTQLRIHTMVDWDFAPDLAAAAAIKKALQLVEGP